MNKGRIFYCSIRFPTIFLSLVLFTLTNLSINLFLLWNEDDHEVDRIHTPIHDHFTISPIPKIMAMSDYDNIINSHSILDKVRTSNLEKAVRDLSSFHTRHTESEFIDDVTYWLTNKLRNVCSSNGIYVHNFTQIPNEDDTVDSNKQ